MRKRVRSETMGQIKGGDKELKNDCDSKLRVVNLRLCLNCWLKVNFGHRLSSTESLQKVGGVCAASRRLGVQIAVIISGKHGEREIKCKVE